MVVQTKNVFYLKFVAAPIFIDLLTKRPDVTLFNLGDCTTEEARRPILAAAHA